MSGSLATTQALNYAAAGGEVALKNNAHAIKQERILRRSFWRGPDWSMFVPPLIIADSGVDLSGLVGGLGDSLVQAQGPAAACG